MSAPPSEKENRRIGTLTGEPAKRRFNVAASRAREQMWLYHTATLNDLNPACIRYNLLKYCSTPHVEKKDAGCKDLNEIQHMACTEDRSSVSPPDPFDSWFEVDVFLRIIERGYRVLPQYEVAGYSIYMVVQGMEKAFAIECDGDRWHGPDRYQHDMARQRELERCGWSFWRVRGSNFYLEPEKAMEGLWQALEKHQIYSAGRGSTASTEKEKMSCGEHALLSERRELNIGPACLPAPMNSEGVIEELGTSAHSIQDAKCVIQPIVSGIAEQKRL